LYYIIRYNGPVRKDSDQKAIFLGMPINYGKIFSQQGLSPCYQKVQTACLGNFIEQRKYPTGPSFPALLGLL
jgi:hypothetical protein